MLETRGSPSLAPEACWGVLFLPCPLEGSAHFLPLFTWGFVHALCNELLRRENQRGGARASCGLLMRGISFSGSASCGYGVGSALCIRRSQGTLTWQPLGIFAASARMSVDTQAGSAQWLPWVQFLVLMGSQYLIIISRFHPPWH